MAACRFYRDPLRKVDFISKKSHKINILAKLARIKYIIPKTYGQVKLSVAGIKYNLSSQRVTVKSTFRHLLCYGQLCHFRLKIISLTSIIIFCYTTY